MEGAVANLCVLLRGGAINYPVKDQSARDCPWEVGNRRTYLRLADDITGLVRKAIDVQAVAANLAERGHERTDLVDA